MSYQLKSEEKRGDITVREYRYDSGHVEIALYAPEILKGAGAILMAVVDRPAGVKKWWVHTDRSRAYSHRKKQFAVAYALEYAQKAAAKHPKLEARHVQV